MSETTAAPTIGIFAGIYDRDGRLLIKKRGPEEKTFVGDWDLPGGGLDFKAMTGALDERVLVRELIREVMEETGIVIPLSMLDPMPAMYPAVLKGGKDIAFLVRVGFVDSQPTQGVYRYVNTIEFVHLCNQSEGDRIVSGPGKRMSRLGLKALSLSPNDAYAKLAQQALSNIYQQYVQGEPIISYCGLCGVQYDARDISLETAVDIGKTGFCPACAGQ